MSIPYFIYNNVNSLDVGLIIENELNEFMPDDRVEETTIIGRSGTLHKWFGDYDAFDYPIKDITIHYDKLADVKQWLRGSGKLIIPNDLDKYRIARPQLNVTYENEWDYFYNFSLVFECQPYKYKVNEEYIILKNGENEIVNNGTEISYPYFEIISNGGNIDVTFENNTFTLLNTKAGLITLDCENGLAIFDGSIIKTKGKYPFLNAGINTLFIEGNTSSIKMKKRSRWV